MSRLSFPFYRSLCASACLLMSGATSALSGSAPAGQGPILVHCASTVLPEFCTAVTDALVALETGRTVQSAGAAPTSADGLTIDIRQIDHNAVRYSAQLVWQASGDRAPHEGPVFEVASMDAPIRPQALRELAQLLVDRSDLPL